MGTGIVIVSLAASYLIVAWMSIFIKKMKRRRLLNLITRAEMSIETHKKITKIFNCHIPDELYNKEESHLKMLEFLSVKSSCDYIISRVKKIREEHSKLKAVDK